MGVPYGGSVGYCFKRTDRHYVTGMKNIAASCVLRLGFEQLHEILDERPEGK
jgi:hypothetical protein